ncbi:unnamed protein product, partial [Brachionus calyciflorus]
MESMLNQNDLKIDVKNPRKRQRQSDSGASANEQTIIKFEYNCDKCSYKTLNHKKYEKHCALTDCNSNEIQCEFCDKKFKDLKIMEQHRNLHLGIKPFKCDHCESYFGTKGEMSRHVKYKHTMEKPHKCSICDYSTVELSKLKRHMRVHTDERPYLCHLCDYASRDTFRLKRHLRTHTGEKPYECPVCKNKFSQSNGLKAHIKTFHAEIPIFLDEHGSPIQNKQQSKRKIKTKIDLDLIENKSQLSSFIITENDSTSKENTDELFTCDQCFMKFLTKELLTEHTVKHTGERPFDCEICGMKFSHKFALRAHLLSHDAGYNEKLSQTLTNASQFTKNRLSHKKNQKLSPEFVETTDSEEDAEEITPKTFIENSNATTEINNNDLTIVNSEEQETLSTIIEKNFNESLLHSQTVQLVTLTPVPNLKETDSTVNETNTIVSDTQINL